MNSSTRSRGREILGLRRHDLESRSLYKAWRLGQLCNITPTKSDNHVFSKLSAAGKNLTLPFHKRFNRTKGKIKIRDKKKSKTTPHRGIEPRALKEVSIRTLENIQNITYAGHT